MIVDQVGLNTVEEGLMEPRIVLINGNTDEAMAWLCKTESEARNMVVWLRSHNINAKQATPAEFEERRFQD